MTNRLNLKLPPKESALLDELSKRLGYPKTTIINQAIRFYHQQSVALPPPEKSKIDWDAHFNAVESVGEY